LVLVQDRHLLDAIVSGPLKISGVRRHRLPCAASTGMPGGATFGQTKIQGMTVLVRG